MVDLILIVMLAGAAVLGWQRGLVVSMLAALAFTLAGLPFAAAAAVMGRPAPVLAFAVGGLLGLFPFAIRLHTITATLEGVLPDERWRVADRAGGALLNIAVAVCVSWFVGAIAMIAPSESPTLSAMRSSAVLGSLIDAVPPQGTLGVLVLRSGIAPSVNGPLVLAEEPLERSANTPAVLAARARVVQVRGEGCGEYVSGTGWVAGEGIVVTNAHVVAGTTNTVLAGGPTFAGAAATVTAFDPVNDIAVLVLEPGSAGLPPPLPIVARVRHGEAAAVIGYPRGGEQRVVAARIDRVSDYEVVPLGGGPAETAPVLAFRAAVEPGNSGGPIVAEDGSVLGLVVSKAIGQRVAAGYGVASAQLLPVIAEGARRIEVPTGACLPDEALKFG